MHIAKHPKIGDFVFPEGKERGACPFDALPSGRVAEKSPAMDAMESQTRKSLLVLNDQIKEIAAVVAKRRVHKVDIRRKPLVAALRLAQRASKGKIG